MKHLLEVDSIEKLIGYKYILSDVYIGCQSGEIIGLLGRNGSGKTTLFNIIMGVVKAENRYVSIDKKKLINTKEVIQQISYLPQKSFIPKGLTVNKAIELAIDRQDLKEIKTGILNTYLTRRVAELSFGELRLLELAIVLYNKSKFVLLDEPFSGLSPIFIEQIIQILLLNVKRKGIILSDHNWRSLLRVSNRLVVLKDGKTHHLRSDNELVNYGYLNSLS